MPDRKVPDDWVEQNQAKLEKRLEEIQEKRDRGKIDGHEQGYQAQRAERDALEEFNTTAARVDAEKERGAEAQHEAHSPDASTDKEQRQALLSEIDKGAERGAASPEEREAAKRALDDHIDRGPGAPDAGDTRQGFRDTAYEITGTTTPNRDDIER